MATKLDKINETARFQKILVKRCDTATHAISDFNLMAEADTVWQTAFNKINRSSIFTEGGIDNVIRGVDEIAAFARSRMLTERVKQNGGVTKADIEKLQADILEYEKQIRGQIADFMEYSSSPAI